MKKSVLFIIFTIAVSLCVCSCVNENKFNESTPPSVSEVSPNSQPEESPISQPEESNFYSFEELIGFSNEIVMGVFRQEFNWPEYDLYIFDVTESLLGENKVGESIALYGNSPVYHTKNGSADYVVNQNEYTVGEEYILVTQKYKTANGQYEYYLVGEIFIPVKDIGSSTVYGELLEKHCTGYSVFSPNPSEYISDLAKNNDTSALGDTEVMHKITDTCLYVSKIKVESVKEYNAANNLYQCSVITDFKMKTENKNINLVSQNKDLSAGDTLIVAMEEYMNSGNAWYKNYSAFSFWETEKEKEISEYIGDFTQPEKEKIYKVEANEHVSEPDEKILLDIWQGDWEEGFPKMSVKYRFMYKGVTIAFSESDGNGFFMYGETDSDGNQYINGHNIALDKEKTEKIMEIILSITEKE